MVSMKFRIVFAVSKTEQSFRLRFWKWDIWQLYLHDDKPETLGDTLEKSINKAGFLSFKKDNLSDAPEAESDSSTFAERQGKLLFQALFYPDVEKRIFTTIYKFWRKVLKFRSVKFENVEVYGTLNDPFYDAIACGISSGMYFPDWENENAAWSAKGELIIKISLLYIAFLTFYVLYAISILAFYVWRGFRLAKKYPNGENLSPVRKWIFLKAQEAV